MAFPSKIGNIRGLMAKVETTYGTSVALSTTADGIRLFFADRNAGALFQRTTAFDGDLGPSVSALGPNQRAAVSGLAVTGNLPMRARGPGAAYTASVLPNIHALLLASGFGSALSTTSGSESMTYTPDTPTATPSSLYVEGYALGEKWPVTGVILSPSFTFDNPAPPMWTFALRGIYNDVTDAAVPTISYPQDTIVPPLSTSTLTIGSFTSNAVMYAGSFDMQRQIDNARVALTASGAHLGFYPGDYKPVFKVTVEATAFVSTPFHTSAGLNPFKLIENGTSIGFSWLFGTTQYNKYKVEAVQCQLIDAQEVQRGPIACWELTIAGYNSTGSTSDSCKITFT